MVHLELANIRGPELFLKTQHIRAMQFRAEQLSIFVLSSHLDPIVSRHDVRQPLFLFIVLGLCLLFLPFFFPIYIPTQSISPPLAP